MTAEACRRWHGELAALALGRLDPDREVAVQAHLDGCAGCRDELGLLQGTVRALEMVDAAELGEGPGEPPPDLEARIAARHAAEQAEQAGQRRRSRRRRVLAAASLAAAAVLVALVLAWPDRGAPDESFARAEEGAEASFALEAKPFGTEVRLAVDGLDDGVYWLWLTDAAGERTAAGTFRGGTGERVVTLTAGVDRDDVDRVWVTDEADRVVLDTR